MSNTSNIFGDVNLDLGPVSVTYDVTIGTGDTGTDQDLGDTQGVTLNYSIEKADLVADQSGTSPANRVITGENCTLEMNLVQVTYERLASVLQGFQSFTAGAEGAAQISKIGQSDKDIAVPLELIKLTGTVASSDEDDKLIICEAAPTGEVSFAYDSSTQRVATINWQCYASDVYIEVATSSPSFFFTRSALTAGHINYVTGA